MQQIAALVQEIGPSNLALALLVLGAGAMTQAAIGMGLNLFSVGALALIHPSLSPGPVLVHSFLLSIVASAGLRKDIEVRNLALSISGIAIGTVIAAALLVWIGRQWLPQLMGALVLVGVALSSAGLRVRVHAASILAATVAAGVMGAIAGTHGPPIALLYQREAPQRVRAALLPLFAAANPLAIAALLWAHLFGWREFYASVLLLPGLAAGYFAAPLLIRVLTPSAIRIALLGVSAVTGLLLLFK